MKRLLDCTASDFAKMMGQALKQAIKASEGRVLIAEVITNVMPLYPSVTNAELAASFGADMILLNFVDVFAPEIAGLQLEDPAQAIRRLKSLVGRPLGINLEPVDPKAQPAEMLDTLPAGRMASAESFAKAKELGFDFICLTGNPKTGVTNQEIRQAVQTAREVLGEDMLIIAGKMHGAGVAGEAGGEIVNVQEISSFAQAGADVVLLPSPGTVPGISVEVSRQMVLAAQREGALALLATGTSQEGADEATIRQIALNSKMAGADLYHIGDGGFTGIAVPENIMTYSIVIRGRRHTYIRMASSVLR